MKKNPVILLLIIVMAVACNNEPKETGSIQIIPAPMEAEVFPGFFYLNSETKIVSPEGIDNQANADYLISLIQASTGFKMEAGNGSDTKNVIQFIKSDKPDLEEEGYILEVNEDRVIISANTSNGLFYGVQSLLQILPTDIFASSVKNTEWKIPNCRIQDKPRFSWRGMHLDVSRHFFPVDFVKKFIDMIALHKMNVFHWHLTDDNGWRIEIKQYPKLTELGAWRVDREDMPWREVTPPKPGEKATYGGFYTQEEIKDVIAYAAKRHITVIPEIEMPGHTSEVFAAYPLLSCKEETLYVQPGSYWPNVDILCAGKEETFEFLENVLTEVMALFPSEYVHIGGDEATKLRWQECSRCQARIKNEGLANEDELQSWFIKRIEKFLINNDKKLIGWDEILEGGLAPEATVMSWRGMKGGIEAAEQGHDVIMCPTSHCYFDYYQANPDFEPVAIGGFTTLKKVYNFEPVPEELENSKTHHILGAQGNVWTEYIPSGEHAEYMSLPRMTALAEVVWSPLNKRNWIDFQERLQTQLKRFDLLDINYSKGSWKVKIIPKMVNGIYKVELESEQYNLPILYNIDGSDLTEASNVYTEPLSITGSSTIKAGIFKDGELQEYESVKKIIFHKGIGKESWLQKAPNHRYEGQGALSLTDGLMGSDNFRDGFWLGFEGVDLDFEVDLGSPEKITSISIDFLQNSGSWIFMPQHVIISIYNEDKVLIAEKTIEPEATMEVKGTIIEEFSGKFDQPDARYIKIFAKNMESIPEWHEGNGNRGWIFIDEIVIH